jgi:hypothetical protein
MFIERICPGLVPAIWQAFPVPVLVTPDEIARAFVQFGDYALGLGVLSVLLVAGVAWIGLDLLRFVRRELARRRKNAA